ncbi:MAG: hypothetical protein LJF06_06855 [Gemmatimonadetes bacterium]|nr:hypothetical protein [Gemmatimonadota bacterium]
MADKAPRRGAAGLTVPLMILAVVIIGGFFYWLFLQASDQKAKEQMQLDSIQAAKANAYPDAREVAGTDLEQDPAGLVGALVKVEPLPVASDLGTQGFWLELPNKNPFLVSLDDSLIADSLKVPAGENVEVVGIILTMSDSVVDSWVKAGHISQGDKLAAQFATNYLQARHVEVQKGQAGGGAPGGGTGGSGTGGSGGGGS